MSHSRRVDERKAIKYLREFFVVDPTIAILISSADYLINLIIGQLLSCGSCMQSPLVIAHRKLERMHTRIGRDLLQLG